MVQDLLKLLAWLREQSLHKASMENAEEMLANARHKKELLSI